MIVGPNVARSGIAASFIVNKTTFLPPKRSLGQNFLVDTNICHRIVACAELTAGQAVLEIGPGRGALTRILVNHQGPVLALEKDACLAAWLKVTFPGLGLLQADGLEFAWEGTDNLPDLTVLGNLPYNVASPMIWEMVSRCRAFRSMVFMVQKEVAERLVARAGSRTYGALSAWVGNFAQATLLFTVPPQVFRPQPKVHSAIVRFTPHLTPAWEDARALSWTLKLLFQKRRKQLGSILKSRWSADLTAWCARYGLDRRVRPEELAPDVLRSLAQELDAQTGFKMGTTTVNTRQA